MQLTAAVCRMAHCWTGWLCSTIAFICYHIALFRNPSYESTFCPFIGVAPVLCTVKALSTAPALPAVADWPLTTAQELEE